MIESHDYQVSLVGTGSKTGMVTSPEGEFPALEVASPPEFGGPGALWSPEHLFVAAVSACLMTTFRAMAAGSGLDVVDYQDEATGRLERAADGSYRITSVTLRPRVSICDASQTDRAMRLIDKAERACLIGRSVNSEVQLEKTVDIVDTPGLIPAIP